MCRFEREEIQEILGKQQGTLSNFAAQLRFQHTLLVQLRQITGGSDFVPMNGPLWSLLVGAHSYLLVEMASFFKKAMKAGGFFRDLRAGNLGSIAIERKPGGLPRDADARAAGERHFEMMSRQARKTLFAELFPTAAAVNRWKVSADDVDELVATFESIVRPIIVERDNVRAHPHETDPPNASKLEWADKALPLSLVQKLYENLRFLLTHGQSNFNEIPRDETEKAQGIVDLLLWGDMQWILLAVVPEGGRLYNERRESLYTRLREEHAKRGGAFAARVLWHELSMAEKASGTAPKSHVF